MTRLGFEPRISTVKGWWLSQFAYRARKSLRNKLPFNCRLEN